MFGLPETVEKETVTRGWKRGSHGFLAGRSFGLYEKALLFLRLHAAFLSEKTKRTASECSYPPCV